MKVKDNTFLNLLIKHKEWEKFQQAKVIGIKLIGLFMFRCIQIIGKTQRKKRKIIYVSLAVKKNYKVMQIMMKETINICIQETIIIMKMMMAIQFMDRNLNSKMQIMKLLIYPLYQIMKKIQIKQNHQVLKIDKKSLKIVMIKNQRIFLN